MISDAIRKVDVIEQVYLDSLTAIVAFYFKTAHQVSEVLNVLISLGYPPLEDVINKKQQIHSTCSCILHNISLSRKHIT